MKKLFLIIILSSTILFSLFAQKNDTSISFSMSPVFTDLCLTNKLNTDLKLETALGLGFGLLKTDLTSEVPITLRASIIKILNEYIPNEKGTFQTIIGTGFFVITEPHIYLNIFATFLIREIYNINEHNSIFINSMPFLIGYSYTNQGFGIPVCNLTSVEDYFSTVLSSSIATLSIGYKYIF